jgi:hypothetical protein
MNVVEIRWSGMDWIGLAQNRHKWRALANAVMKFGFHKMLVNYRAVTELMAYRVKLNSTESVSWVVSLR